MTASARLAGEAARGARDRALRVRRAAGPGGNPRHAPGHPARAQFLSAALPGDPRRGPGRGRRDRADAPQFPHRLRRRPFDARQPPVRDLHRRVALLGRLARLLPRLARRLARRRPYDRRPPPRRHLAEPRRPFRRPLRLRRARFERAGFPPEKMIVRPSSVDDPGPPEEGEHAGIVYAGRLSDEKGVRVLIEAARRATFPLEIIGEGPLAAELAAAAPDHVRLRGPLPREEVRRRIASAEAVVVPSLCYELAAGDRRSLRG